MEKFAKNIFVKHFFDVREAIYRRIKDTFVVVVVVGGSSECI